MRKELVAGGRVDASTGKLVVDLGDGFTLPPDGSFTVAGTPEFMYDVSIRYGWFEGRFDVHEVAVHGREDYRVTSEVLRKVPVERMLRDHLATTVRPPQRMGVDPEDELVLVAATYRIAYLAHRPPVRAVAEQLGMPLSTAGKKVMAARRAKLLPLTSQGKAGA